MIRFGAVLIILILSGCTDVADKNVILEKEVVEKSSPKLQESKTSNEISSKTEIASSKYRTVMLFYPETGWGYDVFEGNKLLIHQPHIPVVQGLRGFKSESDAQKVADAVVMKLSQGIMPPSLSEDEMSKLGVI